MMMILNGKKIFTLLLVLDEKNERVLLGKKRRGFGVGLFNGFGGKVEEEDHSVYESALRELEEEATIKALDCIEVGRITFDWIDEEDKCPWLVHVFRVTKFSGIPEMTEEMIPEWFSYDEIPFDRMWEGTMRASSSSRVILFLYRFFYACMRG